MDVSQSRDRQGNKTMQRMPKNVWMPATLLTWIGSLGLIVFMAAAALEKAAEAADTRDDARERTVIEAPL